MTTKDYLYEDFNHNINLEYLSDDYIKKSNRKINESLKSSPCMKLKEWMTIEGLRN